MREENNLDFLKVDEVITKAKELDPKLKEEIEEFDE